MPLTLSEAAIFSTSLEAILYGFSVFMFMITTKTLFRGYGRRRLNYGMIAAAWALLLLSTAEMAVNIARLHQGFVSKGPALPGGPEQYFALARDPTFILKSCLYNAQTAILDAVVIFRAWVVWQSLLVIAIPTIGWCGLVAVYFGLNISFARQTTDAESRSLFPIETGHWVLAAYSLTLFTNLVTTVILAFKIWNVLRRSTNCLSQSSLTPVLHAIIESGAIYSLAITASLIAFVARSNYVYVILDMLSPIISVVFSLIIVRVGLSKDQDHDDSRSIPLSRNTLAWASPSCRTARRRHDSMGFSGDIAVEITREVYTESVTPAEVDQKPPGLALRSSSACPTPEKLHCRDARSPGGHVRSV